MDGALSDIFQVRPSDLSVVLTGATGGVGAALARELVARGARVLLIARNAAPLAALARELAREDDNRHRIDALAADVTSASARIGVRDAAIARNANVLINAASTDASGPFPTLDAARIDAVLQTNLVAAMHLTGALLPHLLQQRSARILNIGSAVDGTGLPGATAFIGLRGFCEALRRELAGTAVRAQFLGRFSARQELDTYVAGVALRMLLSGTSERFLGASDGVLARLDAVATGWLVGMLDRGNAVRRLRKAAPTRSVHG
jgi:short-subunit dehydrogenase